MSVVIPFRDPKLDPRFIPQESSDGLDMFCLRCHEVLHFNKQATIEGIKKDCAAHECKAVA